MATNEDPQLSRGHPDDVFQYEDETAPYILVLRYDNNNPKHKVVSGTIYNMPSRALDKVMKEELEETTSDNLQLTLPEALIGKTLNPKQLEKFKKILNDQIRWAELLKELE